MLPLQGKSANRISELLDQTNNNSVRFVWVPHGPQSADVMIWLGKSAFTRNFSKQFKEEPDLLDNNKEEFTCWISSFCLQVTWSYGMNTNTFFKN